MAAGENSAVPISPGTGVNVDVIKQDNGDVRQVIVIGNGNDDKTATVGTTGLEVYVKGSDVEQNLEIKNLGGNAIYSSASGDFTATATNGTKEIVLSAFANPDMESALSVQSLVNGNVKKITSAGVVTDIPLTSIALTGTTFTLANAPVNFVTTDKVEVTLIGPVKAYNSAEDVMEFKDLTVVEGEDTTAHVLGTIFKPVLSDVYTPQAGDNTYSSKVTKKLEKAGPGNVYAVQVYNFGSSLAYFQLHNKSSAAPVATETPMAGCVWPVPAGSATVPGQLKLTIDDLVPSNYHSIGIGWALSSTLATFTDALSAADYVVNIRRI